MTEVHVGEDGRHNTMKEINSDDSEACLDYGNFSFPEQLRF